MDALQSVILYHHLIHTCSLLFGCLFRIQHHDHRAWWCSVLVPPQGGSPVPFQREKGRGRERGREREERRGEGEEGWNAKRSAWFGARGSPFYVLVGRGWERQEEERIFSFCNNHFTITWFICIYVYCSQVRSLWRKNPEMRRKEKCLIISTKQSFLNSPQTVPTDSLFQLSASNVFLTRQMHGDTHFKPPKVNGKR